MIGLLTLEQKAWMTERERKQFFQLLDVPKHQIQSYSYQKVFKEYPVGSFLEGETKTVEIVRPFSTLPKWLKKRIKFRLRHPNKFFDTRYFKSTTVTDIACVMGKCNCHTNSFNFANFVERITNG